MMGKKKGFIVITIFVTLACVGGVIFFYDNGQREVYAGYDSIGGKKVTKENILQLVESVPVAVKKKVAGWFNVNPQAYRILVEQNGFLTDVGQFIFNARAFLNIKGIKSVGNFNYVFKFPGEDFFIKIFGANNRFIYTTSAYNIIGLGLYLRLVEKKCGGQLLPYYAYMDFQQDKKRIKNYFYLCCPRDILRQVPTKKQLKALLDLLVGAFPQVALRGFLYDCLVEKYAHNDFNPATVEDAFNQMLDFACEASSFRCYNRKDLAGKKFIDTYNIANRVFHRARFVEAIEKFHLDRLEKPPQSYVIRLNSHRPHSCIDKDVVLVQYPLQSHKPFKFYLKRPSILNVIFDKETFAQLLKAMKYAGLWDITGENIQVNTKTNKVTYIDFEPKNDILPHEIFNKCDKKRKLNLCYLMFEFLKRFAEGTIQREAVCEFILSNHEIDLTWYQRYNLKKHAALYRNVNFEFKKKLAATHRHTVTQGPLGKLLYYFDPTSDSCAFLRKEVKLILTV